MVVPKEKRIYLGLLAAACCLLGVIVFAVRSGWSFRQASEAVMHTTEVVGHLDELRAQVQGLSAGARGYVITGNPEFLKAYEEAVRAIPREMTTLQHLTADNADQQQRLVALSALINERLTEGREIVEVRRTQGGPAAAEMVGRDAKEYQRESIRAKLTEMKKVEEDLLERRLDRARRDGQWSAIAFASGLLLGACFFVVLYRQVRAREADARAIRRHSDEIHDLYNNAPCGYHSVDAGGVVTAINDTELRWLGAAREEVVGKKKFADLMTPESRETYLAAFEKFKQTGEVHDVEFELVRRDGSTFPVLLSSTAIYDDAGQYVSSRSMLYDHSERRRAEQILQQSRDFAESIVETMREPLVLLDGGLRVARANRSFLQTFQLTSGEVVGRPLEALADGQWKVPQLLDALREVVPADRELTDFEISREFAGLGPRTMLLNARKLYRPGNHTENLLLAMEDITARRKVEQMQLQFRALFESLPGLYVILDPELHIVAASDAFLKATLLERADVIGQNIFDVFPDNPATPEITSAANLRASLERVRAFGKPDTMSLQRYDVRRRDGSFEERHWSPINSPVFGMGGKLEYIVHRVEDVTEFVLRKGRSENADDDLQNRLEQMETEIYRSTRQVEQANQRLTAANAELEAFSYTVSHDLRAPLRHISGFAQMLTRHLAGGADDKAQHYLRTISGAAQQMGTLIDELLAFSRIGRSEMRATKVPLDTLVEEVLRGLKTDLEGREIDWKIASLPTVEGDPALLRQVFANLIGNAVKYTRKREQAQIEIGTQESAPDEITVFIRDNGAGFDQKYASKLFGVFQRLHSAAEFEGSGVGLATVRRIVQRHGGRVSAEGELGAGATFFVTLPGHATGFFPTPSET